MVQVLKELKKFKGVKLVMSVHDQIDTIADAAVAPEWSMKLKYIMEESAKLTIPTGFLKAEVTISKCWQK